LTVIFLSPSKLILPYFLQELIKVQGFSIRKDLPGKPDLVLTRHRKIIEVKGCFWHMHNCRYGRVKPKTHSKFWQNKRSGNREHDRKYIRKLRRSGWDVLVVWECWTRTPERLQAVRRTPQRKVEGYIFLRLARQGRWGALRSER